MRRWSELSQVERVDVYTRQSLYVILWLFAAMTLFSAGDPDELDPLAFVLAVLWVTVLTAVASLVMHDVFDLHPASGPLPWRGIVPLLLMSALTVAGALTQPEVLRNALVSAVFVALGWSLGGLRDRRIVIGLVLGLGVLVAATTGEPAIFVGGVVAASFFAFTVHASLWLFNVVTELDQARPAQAALAVAEERLRFSRDVHDVMGRRLSAIAMQAELAATLARRKDPTAAERMLHVRQVAHEALREARELARGYRAIDLHQELEGARSLLRSAGIDVRLEVADVPDAWQEPAAWVVREAVTNVLRHSAATGVDIVFRSPDLVVTNDGVAPAPDDRTGSGIDGLRERLAPLGATLTSTTLPGGFRLMVRFSDAPEETA